MFTISADTMTANCRRNVKPEIAELKGKRLAIAAELEEGMLLSTSVLKQVCSTDVVRGEKKFKDPFDYTPTHTVVLYTNHLPKVRATDEGTWRRLIVIPFHAKIEGKSDIKNYSDYLFENAGSYVLAWIIEGARKAIEADFHLERPKVVADAIAEYRGMNDWLEHFLEECCVRGDGLEEKSGELYQEYRSYCLRTGEISRNNADFTAVLEKAGYTRKKTSIVLSALNELMYNSFEVTKILIIAPLRVARNTWSDEIKKWDHLKGLRYSIAVGTATERKKALAADADIFIINRENVQWLVEQSGVPFDFDMVVIDELSSFKNWQAKRFKSFMKVRPMVKRVVGLTGTPSSNGLMDLFAEFKVLDMGERLGRFIGQYRVNYFKPDRMNGPIVYTYKLLPGAEDRIYDKISDITISMKETDYLEMPELISTEYKVYLDDTEKAKYEALRDEFVLQLPGGEITASNAATLSGKLSQLANGAIYSDDGDVNIFHERKLDALEDLIEAANGKPVLVAYWFKHDLRRISERLSNLGIDYQQLDSDASIKKWNAGQLQVGLIHPASAGHGLNLQSGGNILVWFGITWSLELYQQTVARLWRQGQTEGTVSVIHIVTDGTVDERILKALEAKDLTQSALIDAVKAEVGDGK